MDNAWSTLLSDIIKVVYIVNLSLQPKGCQDELENVLKDYYNAFSRGSKQVSWYKLAEERLAVIDL
ncbi:hypothetical protein V2J09_016072 [Rumex salicifolius]